MLAGRCSIRRRRPALRFRRGDAGGGRPPAARAVLEPDFEPASRVAIDGVEQLTRYLDLLNRDPLLAPVPGVFAAQEIRPQARTLAEDRGIRCLVLDYDSLRGIDDADGRLF